MLGLQHLLKRVCNYRYRNSSTLSKGINPLVECETVAKHGVSKPYKEIHVNKYIDYKIYSEVKPLPIQIEYFEKDKVYKITIHLSK